LVTTDSDEAAIAAAIVGDGRMPENVYKIPAAAGVPTPL